MEKVRRRPYPGTPSARLRYLARILRATAKAEMASAKRHRNEANAMLAEARRLAKAPTCAVGASPADEVGVSSGSEAKGV